MMSALEKKPAVKRFTYLPMPKEQPREAALQLGLFDSPLRTSRGMDYIGEEDEKTIQKQSARLMGSVHTTDLPDHESVVIITAKHKSSGRFLYKLYPNVEELQFATTWGNATELSAELSKLSGELQKYGHTYTFEGTRIFKGPLAWKKSWLTPPSSLFTGKVPWYSTRKAQAPCTSWTFPRDRQILYRYCVRAIWPSLRRIPHCVIPTWNFLPGKPMGKMTVIRHGNT